MADDTTPPPTAPPRARVSPVEMAMLAAMLFALAAVLVPRLVRSRAHRNERAAYFHCYSLLRAEQEQARLKQPYTTPHVLAGGAEYAPGITLKTLNASWRGQDGTAVVDTVFGYRASFFLDEARRHWAFIVWPREWGETGDVAFAATQAGEVYRYEPADPPDWPDREAAATAAWGSVANAASPANATWAPGWRPCKR